MNSFADDKRGCKQIARHRADRARLGDVRGRARYRSDRFEADTAGLLNLREANSVADVLAWAKRAINTGAFAQAAPLLNGPGDAAWSGLAQVSHPELLIAQSAKIAY